MRSAIALNDVGSEPLRLTARLSRSRTTSDFEILRSRDSASIWATRASGRRTVSVFMRRVYYGAGSSARQGGAPSAVPVAAAERLIPPDVLDKADAIAEAIMKRRVLLVL